MIKTELICTGNIVCFGEYKIALRRHCWDIYKNGDFVEYTETLEAALAYCSFMEQSND